MTPHTRPFQQVDVFTPIPYQGNPLAVVLDGTGLSDAQMQRFANWTHLSETTFLLPPTDAGRAAGADYQVRIFDPMSELRFAGHPRWAVATLGCRQAASRAPPRGWYRNAQSGWCRSGATPTHKAIACCLPLRL